MYFILIGFYNFIGFFSSVIVHGYRTDCFYNQTIFAPEGTTATLKANTTISYFQRTKMRKTSGDTQGLLFDATLYDDNVTRTYFRDTTLKNRANIRSQQYSDSIHCIGIDLYNVSMNDNGTYLLYGRHGKACFILYVMEIRTAPVNIREENEPVLVYGHPHSSLIKRPLANATMTWLLDGQYVNQTASVLEQDGHIWIHSVGRNLNGKNVTYRALHDDGKITEINVTLKVNYGPNQPLILAPKTRHYNLISGHVLPDITCTTECNPPCNISWGKSGEGNILSLGSVSTKDTGEYTCIATGSNGRTVEQTISVFVKDVIVYPDHSHFNTAITCLATVQALTIIALGMCTFFIYKRKAPPCCLRILEHVSMDKSDATKVTFSASPVERSECYEELQYGSGNKNITYGEDAGARPPANIYENTTSQSEIT